MTETRDFVCDGTCAGNELGDCSHDRVIRWGVCAATSVKPFALRLYQDGEGCSSLLCREPGHECPQWWYKPDNRYLFATPEEALAFFGVVCSEWPEFKGQDVRVVRVVPPTKETYVEVTEFGCPEPSAR